MAAIVHYYTGLADLWCALFVVDLDEVVSGDLLKLGPPNLAGKEIRDIQTCMPKHSSPARSTRCPRPTTCWPCSPWWGCTRGCCSSSGPRWTWAILVSMKPAWRGGKFAHVLVSLKTIPKLLEADLGEFWQVLAFYTINMVSLCWLTEL